MFPVFFIPRIAFSATALSAAVPVPPLHAEDVFQSATVPLAGLTIDEKVLEPDRYNFAQLGAIAPGKFFDNGGSITVAPVRSHPPLPGHWLRAWERPELFLSQS